MNLHRVLVASLAPAAALAASANGDAVNIRDYIGNVQVTLDSAAGTGTTPTLDVKIQHSANGTDGWADVTGGAFTQVTGAAAAFETLTLDIDGLNPFIRAVDTVAGTDPSFARSVQMIGVKQYN